jgi:hypothetical protein
MSGTREQSRGSKARAEKGLNVSGSDWGKDHLKAFNITCSKGDQLTTFLKAQGVDPLKLRLKKNLSKLLHTSIGANAQYSNKPHVTLFEEAEEANAQLGPFLAFLAVVGQAWKETEEVVGRKSARIAAKKSSAAHVFGTSLDQLDLGNDDFATPQKNKSSRSPSALKQTPQHVAARQQKAEIVTNTMAVLFLQAILESSRSLLAPPKNNYLEWHFIPTLLHVTSSKANCQSINDGSLFRKHFQQRGDGKEWLNADQLLYASIEVGERFASPKPEIRLHVLTGYRQRPGTVYG